MPFLPEKRFVIEAGEAPEVIRERLEEQVAPARPFARRRPDRPFAGKIGASSFELRPVLGYRNSFVPFVQGSYGSGLDGTRIDVRMRLLRPVAAFMAAWLTFAAVFVVLALAFFSVGYGCMSVLFWLEARRTRAKLEELLA